MNATVFHTRIDSPIGALLLTSDGEALTGVFMEEHRHGPRPDDGWRRDGAPFAAAREQLAAYFAGERTGFELPLAPSGTAFQRRVWEELRRIPFGETISYAELARRVGDPRAVRAVGGANGRNPLSVVVPCHRVIGADGSLTGYGGGIERKRWLLGHEARFRGEARP